MNDHGRESVQQMESECDKLVEREIGEIKSDSSGLTV